MASKQPVVVLSKEHYDAIIDAQRRIKDVRQMLPQAERCGVDCTEYTKIADQADAQLQTYLKEWFAKGRPK